MAIRLRADSHRAVNGRSPKRCRAGWQSLQPVSQEPREVQRWVVGEFVIRRHGVCRVLPSMAAAGCVPTPAAGSAVDGVEDQRFGEVVRIVVRQAEQHHAEWGEILSQGIGVFCELFCRMQTVIAVDAADNFIPFELLQIAAPCAAAAYAWSGLNSGGIYPEDHHCPLLHQKPSRPASSSGSISPC